MEKVKKKKKTSQVPLRSRQYRINNQEGFFKFDRGEESRKGTKSPGETAIQDGSTGPLSTPPPVGTGTLCMQEMNPKLARLARCRHAGRSCLGYFEQQAANQCWRKIQ